MKNVKVGFIVYGVHKDGLPDPMGQPFIDEMVTSQAKQALEANGLELEVHETVVATKAEAIEALSKMKKDDSVTALIMFSATWVWAANLIAPVRDFASTGKSIVVWTHPGSQGWRTVGGLVFSGALKEIGIKHKFVYGKADCAKDVKKIVSFCKASAMRSKLNMSTIYAFGGRGMGQTCGVADPSQWMKTFGIDIDSRDTTELVNYAQNLDEDEVEKVRVSLTKWFDKLPEESSVTDKSIRLYMAMKELKKNIGFDYYTIQSFPGLADDYAATCFMQSMMLEDGVATSTLSDFNTLMTTILLTEFAEERVYYGDLQHINKETKEIKIIGDGAIPPSLAGKLDGGKAHFGEHGIPTEGAAGGLSVNLVAKSGKGVLARLGRSEGRFQMILVKCEVFEPSAEEIYMRKLECGIPFWPHAFVRVDCDMDKLIDYWNNEYACLGYGEDLFQIISDFCEQTGIELLLP